MLITIEVNKRELKAEKGETILSALTRNGIKIPTLCRMKELSPTGACRICVVEVEGAEMLVTACSEPVQEWMKIKTHSPRVIKARKTIVELLLSSHPDNCLYCDRNLNCELQKIARELDIRERRIRGKKQPLRLDLSSPAITRELSKCILCGRCVRICGEVVMVNTLDFIGKGKNTHIGTTMDKDFNFSSCIHCGQCVNVCPTGALHEKYNIREVQDYLVREGVFSLIQYSPLVAYSIAEEMGVKYSDNFERKLNEALLRIGFDRVYTTAFGADIMITELAEKLMKKKSSDPPSALFTSHCPAWVKYAEQFMPEILDQLSDLKSSQQITAAVLKTLVPDLERVNESEVYSVSVTACTAAKYEARRDVMAREGISDIETVLTVRELVQVLQLYGIDMDMLDGRHTDEPLDMGSSSSILAEISGGLTEAVIRLIAGQYNIDVPSSDIRNLRTGGNLRELEISSGKRVFNFAVVDGLSGLGKLREKMRSVNYDMIEVMACPFGCVNGGGINSAVSGKDIKDRVKLLYKHAEKSVMYLPMDNPALYNFYEKWLPANKELASKKPFRNKYSTRDVLL